MLLCQANSADVPDRLRDRNPHMEIWLIVNCFDQCKSSSYMKNNNKTLRVMTNGECCQKVVLVVIIVKIIVLLFQIFA